MSIRIERGSNSQNINVVLNGTQLMFAEYVSPLEGAQPSLFATWETNRGVEHWINELKEQYLILRGAYKTPRELAKPPRYLYLGDEDSLVIPGYGEIRSPFLDDTIAYDLSQMFERKFGTPVADHIYRRKRTIDWLGTTTPFFASYTDGEQKLHRRITMAAYEFIPDVAVGLLTSTIQRTIDLSDRKVLTDNLTELWRDLPRLQRIRIFI